MQRLPINIANMDPVDAALLPVIRHHLAALQGENPLAWRQAFAIAEQQWGEGRGLALAHRSQVFLSALLSCRNVPIRCIDPLNIDERHTLTEDERLIMNAVSAMRSDDAPQARQLIALLTGGRLTAVIIQAGLSLALLLETPKTTIRRPDAPKLRAVS